ncbi:hypothetical protein A2U01_0098314, partial [Trifolium medium]|nr:hypothetical protein [Trifolium medium]
PPARRAACSGAARSVGSQGRFNLRVTARRAARVGATRSLALLF